MLLKGSGIRDTATYGKNAGQSGWKLQNIADKVVELGILNHISATSIVTVQKKMNSSS
jgi:hypothetical protein